MFLACTAQGLADVVDSLRNIGALIIRIGYWGPLYYN